MYDITETRWCPHGKRLDDECSECDVEETPHKERKPEHEPEGS